MAGYSVPWGRHTQDREENKESSIPVEQPCDRSTVSTYVLRSFLSFLCYPLRSRRAQLWLWSGVPAMNGHYGELCWCVWVVLVCAAVCGRHPITSPERSSFPSYRDEWSP